MGQTVKKKDSSKQTFVISETMDNYLRSLGELSILKAEQITKRWHKMGMVTTVRSRLFQLSNAGYVQIEQVPTKKSKSPNFYALSVRGVRYIEETHGIEADAYFKPSELKELSHPYLWHALELNDFIILTQTLERVYPEYYLETFKHDFAMKKDPIRFLDGTVKNKKGETVNKYSEIPPDGFLDIRKKRSGKKSLQWCIWLELDRGTEQTEDSFKEKIRRIYKAIASGEIHKYFEVKELAAVVFATTAGEKRVEQMRRWALSVFKKMYVKQEIIDLFLFGTFSSDMTHDQVFFEDHWMTANEDAEKEPLLNE